ncbi:PREDICTED: flocculation protein FLO11-like [Dipodomys ordii]|uniref:Flocculation protein FLO11-like n=1 Tax=Dipodomys ordii TaxID=10020 RepID=A0A1S3GRH2_DIPOR|nr:PREDICTED: flocculation protein FLO11-like [Dipodomys ordii]
MSSVRLALRDLECLYCPASALSSVCTAQRLSCPASVLSSVCTVQRLPCPASALSSVCAAQRLRCPASALSSVCTAQRLSCPASALSSVCTVQRLPCPASALSSVCTVQRLRCPASALSSVCAAQRLRCPASALSSVCPVQRLPCPASALSSVCPAQRLPCPASALSSVCPVQRLRCPASALSSVCAVQRLRCPASALSSVCPAQRLRCPASALSSVCAVQRLHCPASALSSVCAAQRLPCPASALSSVCTVQRLRCPASALSSVCTQRLPCPASALPSVCPVQRLHCPASALSSVCAVQRLPCSAAAGKACHREPVQKPGCSSKPELTCCTSGQSSVASAARTGQRGTEAALAKHRPQRDSGTLAEETEENVLEDGSNVLESRGGRGRGFRRLGVVAVNRGAPVTMTAAQSPPLTLGHESVGGFYRLRNTVSKGQGLCEIQSSWSSGRNGDSIPPRAFALRLLIPFPLLLVGKGAGAARWPVLCPAPSPPRQLVRSSDSLPRPVQKTTSGERLLRTLLFLRKAGSPVARKGQLCTASMHNCRWRRSVPRSLRQRINYLRRLFCVTSFGAGFRGRVSRPAAEPRTLCASTTLLCPPAEARAAPLPPCPLPRPGQLPCPPAKARAAQPAPSASPHRSRGHLSLSSCLPASSLACKSGQGARAPGRDGPEATEPEPEPEPALGPEATEPEPEPEPEPALNPEATEPEPEPEPALNPEATEPEPEPEPVLGPEATELEPEPEPEPALNPEATEPEPEPEPALGPEATEPEPEPEPALGVMPAPPSDPDGGFLSDKPNTKGHTRCQTHVSPPALQGQLEATLEKERGVNVLHSQDIDAGPGPARPSAEPLGVRHQHRSPDDRGEGPDNPPRGTPREGPDSPPRGIPPGRTDRTVHPTASPGKDGPDNPPHSIPREGPDSPPRGIPPGRTDRTIHPTASPGKDRTVHPTASPGKDRSTPGIPRLKTWCASAVVGGFLPPSWASLCHPPPCASCSLLAPSPSKVHASPSWIPGHTTGASSARWASPHALSMPWDHSLGPNLSSLATCGSSTYSSCALRYCPVLVHALRDTERSQAGPGPACTPWPGLALVLGGQVSLFRRDVASGEGGGAASLCPPVLQQREFPRGYPLVQACF